MKKMFLESKTNYILIIPICLALASDSDLDSTTRPSFTVQSAQTDEQPMEHSTLRGSTLHFERDEHDEDVEKKVKNRNFVSDEQSTMGYRRSLDDLDEDRTFGLTPATISSTDNRTSKEDNRDIAKNNHTSLVEASKIDEVANRRFTTEDESSQIQRVSTSNVTLRMFDDNDDNDNSMNQTDDDVHRDSLNEKMHSDEKIRRSNEEMDKIVKSKLEVFGNGKNVVDSVDVDGTREVVKNGGEETSEGGNITSSTTLPTVSHSDDETETKKISRTDKKITSKHRNVGKETSVKKRKTIKKNSRRNFDGDNENSRENIFTEKKRSGHAIIYSEKGGSKAGEKSAHRYKGIDRKPTNVKPQVKKIKTKPEMEELRYYTIVRSRYAITTVTGRMRNYGEARNVNVNVILPHRALITKFHTKVDGRTIGASIKGKNSTLRLPSATVAGENVGTILIETRDCDAVAMSVKVPRNGTLNYTVTYEYLLERNLGFYAVPITIHNNMWIKDLAVRWKIQEERDITKLQTPLIYKTTALPLEDSDDPLVCVTNEEPGMAEIVWEPTIAEQKNISRDLGHLSNRGVVGILEVRYDVRHDQDPCGQVVRQGDYFAQYFAAPNQPPLTKHVVFILDVSDSMQGDPIRQLKKAMFYILDTLQPMDNFTLINFSDEVNIMNIYDRTRDTVYRSVGEGPEGRGKKSGKTPWPGKLETYEATPENIAAAKKAVEMMELRVFTNIYDALIMGYKSVRDVTSLAPSLTGQPHPEPIVIFLTDGHASDGPSYDPDVILKMVEDQNHHTKAPMFALGFGGDADMGLLRRFALATNGIEKHIYKDIDAADQLVTFFQSIKAPVLKDVYFKYSSKQVITGTLTDQSFPMIHRGKEVIIAGRLDPNFPEKASLYSDVTALGRYAMIRCERTMERSRKSSTDSVLIKYTNATSTKRVIGNRANDDDRVTGIVERIWAFLTLEQLRDEIELDHFETHQDTRCDDNLKPIDRMLEICLRLNYAMPMVTNLVYDNAVVERISISPESGDQDEETSQHDPLADFPWIVKLRDKHGFAKLPIVNKKKGRMYTYLSLGISENPLPPRSCADTVDGSLGECRYLPECPDPNVLGTPQKFRRHFCRLGSYAGVCCSDSVPRPSR